MDIYESLKSDHDKVKSLLAELVELPDDNKPRRLELVRTIRDELIPHSRAEESVFYNSLRSIASDAKSESKSPSADVMHSYAEHLAAETLLRTLQVEDTVHLGWKDTAKKLKMALEHHIEEEEGKLFAEARNVFSPSEAEMLGTAFRSLKPEIREEGLMKTTWDMVANMMPPRLGKYLGSYNPSFERDTSNRH